MMQKVIVPHFNLYSYWVGVAIIIIELNTKFVLY